MSVTRKYFAKDEKPVLTSKQLAEIEALKSREIDLSDMPEELDWSDAVRGRFSKRHLPVDDEVFAWLQKDGLAPEVRLNELLHKLMKKEG